MRLLQSILLFVIFFFFAGESFSQWDPSFSQYMNNQLCINPAYTGIRNTISTNLNIKKQWMGVEGSPTTYMLGINGPINKTYNAIGGLISNHKVGPVNTYNASFSYAHLLKLNDQLHLSLGLNIGAIYQNITLSKISIVQSNDPMFQSDLSNQINGDFGAGAFLYSPIFYVGLSFPHLIQTHFSKYDNIEVPGYKRNAYLSSGLLVGLNKSLSIKPSILFKMNDDAEANLDMNALLSVNKKFIVGASYRIKHTMAFIVNVQLSKELLLGYSYDLNRNNSGIGYNSHEISICYDNFTYYRKNRKRMFKKKKKKQEEEESIRSIRNF
ncbi:PorP/SprF family type IX secretion system membrane protein [Plebeiibacterium sediminum]|uniref:Type IX secretion system membrane protein PorP/SprF n=1 Tax=Plebeiibacterium sediminum TaxID=2992112 RepID=A0AAE3M3Z9_9BACT|nr:type IX secretion system membrane protein PorP/SprF [Plebeiobacterium sediminum]MCW3786414.1 type IX secretion system membrane protein PorP/SprF [Plebeiobacterium sediminum]